MPYRSLCCRDVPNLFMAGRCASYTHVAFGSSRVMHAGGQQGVAAGYAASLCKKYNCRPREIYRDAAKTAELQALINKKNEYSWPKVETSREIVSVIVDNADAAGVLGSQGVKVIHVSTDYVFSGDEHVPCREIDSAAPRTAYGRTKYEGEKRLLAACPEAVILRTAWLYSSFGNNFVKTMIRLGREKEQLGVVFDQIGTPTYAADLAWAIFTVIEAPQWHAGIYHFTNEGVCSWYDFTIAIHELAGIKTCAVRPILSNEYAYKTPRPHYSVLDKSKYKKTFNAVIPHWMDGLRRCMKLI